jgi:hypothetical protein
MSPKSVKQIFVGFVDGPRAIKYYNTRTHQIRVLWSYKFLTNIAPVQDVQCEGELDRMDAQKQWVEGRSLYCTARRL